MSLRGLNGSTIYGHRELTYSIPTPKQHPPSRAAVVLAVGPEQLLTTAGAQENPVSLLAIQAGREGRLGSSLQQSRRRVDKKRNTNKTKIRTN